jgi:hypothetical protein
VTGRQDRLDSRAKAADFRIAGAGAAAAPAEEEDKP